MSDTLRVLVIAGGLTHERDVSVRSGRRVANVLTQSGHTVHVHDLDADLLTCDKKLATTGNGARVRLVTRST